MKETRVTPIFSAPEPFYDRLSRRIASVNAANPASTSTAQHIVEESQVRIPADKIMQISKLLHAQINDVRNSEAPYAQHVLPLLEQAEDQLKKQIGYYQQEGYLSDGDNVVELPTGAMHKAIRGNGLDKHA